MRLKPWEFWDLTWAEYASMREGHFLRLEEEILHPTRLILTMMHNTNVGKKGDLTTPDKIMPLSWDKKTTKVEVNPLTQEEITQMLESRNFRPNEQGEYRLSATLTKSSAF